MIPGRCRSLARAGMRVTLLAVLALGLLAAPLSAADALEGAKIHRIGYLAPGRGIWPGVDAFWQGLGELGYEEGQNVVMEYRWAPGISLPPVLCAPASG